MEDEKKTLVFHRAKSSGLDFIMCLRVWSEVYFGDWFSTSELTYMHTAVWYTSSAIYMSHLTVFNRQAGCQWTWWWNLEISRLSRSLHGSITSTSASMRQSEYWSFPWVRLRNSKQVCSSLRWEEICLETTIVCRKVSSWHWQCALDHRSLIEISWHSTVSVA